MTEAREQSRLEREPNDVPKIQQALDGDFLSSLVVETPVNGTHGTARYRLGDGVAPGQLETPGGIACDTSV
jgi:hypothetical protein